MIFSNLATMTKKGSPIVLRDGGLRFAGWKINLPATTFHPHTSMPRVFAPKKNHKELADAYIFNSFLSDSY